MKGVVKMATINGTLKYKQDDGSIVELNPVGVDARARTLATAAGQTANNAQTAADNAQSAADTALQYIGDWPLTAPTDTITTEVKTLNTRVKKLERLPTLDLPIIGIVTSTGPNTVTIDVPIPSVVRFLTVKGYVPTFSILGGTISIVFEYNDANTINNFALSSVSVSDLGVFVSITGNPAPSLLAIKPGTFVWGSYKQAATDTTLHVTFS
jgi:hypothetical protein